MSILEGSSADLIYGASGTRKTTMIGDMAEYVVEKTGKPTRVLHSDLGGYAPLEPYIHAGIVQLWAVADQEFYLEALDKVSQGYWPDATGKLVTSDVSKIGAYAFEGVTSFAEGIYEMFKAKKIRLSQDPAFTYKVGATEYTGGNQAAIGETQSRLKDLIGKSARLPVDKVLWTALEAKGDDAATKSPVYGPASIGKALNGKMGQLFGNFMHLEQLVTEKGEDPKTKQIILDTRPVLYLRPHADKLTKIPFDAKTRAPQSVAAELPEYLDPPSLKTLYKLLDSLQSKGLDRMKTLQGFMAQKETATAVRQ